MERLKNIAALACLVVVIGVAGSVCGAQTQSDEQLANAALWGPISRGWQLGILSESAGYSAGKPINVVVFVRNGGPSMGVHPLESYAFYTTLFDSHGNPVELDKDWVAAELNTTGINEYTVRTNSVVKSTLHIDQRYRDLAPGRYRVTASTNIVPGSTMDPVSKPVFVHLNSGSAAITIGP